MWERIRSANELRKVPLLSDEVTADELAEAEHLLCYYRMDEGPGTTELLDASEKRVNARLVTNREDMWGEELGLGEPLDYEDRWGVKTSPSRSLRVGAGSYVQVKASQVLSTMASAFTVEMWVKVENAGEDCVILETSCKSLKISIKRNMVTIVNEQHRIEIECKAGIEEGRWTHVAIVWHSSAIRPLCILLNGTLSGSSKELIASPRWASEDMSLCKFEGEVTEIRIWNTNLNERIINENRRVPLGILANRQSAFKFVMKKQESKPGLLSKKSLLARPPPSGFAMPQKHNSLAPPAKLKLRDDHTTSESSPGNEGEQANPFIADAAAALEIRQSESRPVADRNSAPFKPREAKPAEPKRESPLPPKLKSPATRNSQAILKSNQLSVDSKKTLEEDKTSERSKGSAEAEGEMPFARSATATEEIPTGRDSNIWTTKTAKSRASAGKTLLTARGIEVGMSVLDDVVNYLLVGNLKASIKVIEECLKKVGGSEVGLKEKKTLGQIVRYKFLVKLLSSIHQLRKKEDEGTESRVADLANVAVALRVSRKLRPNLYKLAVHFRCT